VHDELLRGERHQSHRASIARGRGRHHHGCKAGDRRRAGGDRPRDQIIHRIHLGRGENASGERGRCFAAIGSRGDDAERASADPRAAALITEHRPPPAAPRKCTVYSPRISDRAGAREENYSRTIAECIHQCYGRVAVHNDFLRHSETIELVLEIATLLFTADAGKAAIQDRRNGIENPRRRKRFPHQLGDCRSRAFGFSGSHC